MPYKYGLRERGCSADARVAQSRRHADTNGWMENPRDAELSARRAFGAKAMVGYCAGPNTASILVFSVAALKGLTM
jgi:hypothetical protein